VQALAEVHVASWRSTYPGLLPEVYLAASTVERRAAFWRQMLSRPDRISLVAEADGGVVGLALAGPTMTPDYGFAGELFALYLLAEHQRQGYGTALLTASRTALRRCGHAGMMLWVLAENPAWRFYECRGGRLIAERTEDYAGQTLLERAYGWDA
jgi:GNAT superfamily N-acetyltransferase